MSADWLQFDGSRWSLPVVIWWGFLIAVSAANVVMFLLLLRRFRARSGRWQRFLAGPWREPWVLLCAAYVFGCAFRAALPRADVQRICLFDTWLSTVVVGRSVATVAEICFVLQWAIVLRQIATLTRSDTVRNISWTIVPLILLAECCSWYAVITTDYLANALENSLWTVAFSLVAVALLRLLIEFRGVVRLAMTTALIGLAAYVAFMAMVDVPMYLSRWQADEKSGKAFLGLLAGLHDVSTRLVVTHNFAPWSGEIAWMTLYFSVAVWTSLALCGFHLVKRWLPRYRTRPVWSAIVAASTIPAPSRPSHDGSRHSGRSRSGPERRWSNAAIGSAPRRAVAPHPLRGDSAV